MLGKDAMQRLAPKKLSGYGSSLVTHAVWLQQPSGSEAVWLRKPSGYESVWIRKPSGYNNRLVPKPSGYASCLITKDVVTEAVWLQKLTDYGSCLILEAVAVVAAIHVVIACRSGHRRHLVTEAVCLRKPSG